MKRLILAILCVLFFAGTAPGSLHEHCIAHYKMNDSADNNTVVDSMGYSNGTAKRNTSVLTTTGKVGGALTFNGTSDYVSTTVTATASGSVAFWFYPVTVVKNEIMFGSAVLPKRWYIGLNAAGKFGAAIGTQSYENIYGGDVLQAGTVWYFGALTWDATTVNLFLNGTDIYSGSISGTISTLPAYIGAVNSNSSPASRFKGNIDNVMIFNKTLTQDEITSLYNGGSGTEILTAPEPATIALLGLGALSLIRRKR